MPSAVCEFTQALTNLSFPHFFLGGWAGGSSGSEDMVKNADLMWKQSVWSSAITARLAHKFLATGGLVVLPGAEPAQSVDGTPGMIGYGMAKAAVHQLTR